MKKRRNKRSVGERQCGCALARQKGKVNCLLLSDGGDLPEWRDNAPVHVYDTRKTKKIHLLRRYQSTRSSPPRRTPVEAQIPG